MRRLGLLGLVLSAIVLNVPASTADARRDATRALDITLIYGKKPAQVQAAMKRFKGVCRSMGKGNSFAEYSLPSASVLILYNQNKASNITVTLRRAVSKPETVLGIIGLSPRGRAPVRQDILMRRWQNLGGIKEVTIKSNDGGSSWETADVRMQPTPSR